LRQGHAKQAQQLAHDPAWRGAAAYRAGDYPAAAQALQQASGGDTAYNLGNTLARQGQYQQAIAAYDHALKLDPGNADAKANRKAVEDWLHRQQQQQPSDQNQHEGHNGSKEPSQAGEQGKGSKPDSQDQKSGQEGTKSSGQPGQDGKAQAQDQSDQKSSEDRSGKDQGGDQPKPQTAQQQAEQQAKAEQAQQALKQQMDQALVHPGDKTQTHQLGTLTLDDPQSKLPADLQHALQRVPDEPGALLRRKFELEYQQRHGGAPGEDRQP
jgi:Ca-activated chloride channel homolog